MKGYTSEHMVGGSLKLRSGLYQLINHSDQRFLIKHFYQFNMLKISTLFNLYPITHLSPKQLN